MVSLVVGHGRVGFKRIGAGPSLTVGVDPTMREALAAVLEAGVPPDVGINYLSPAVFDAIWCRSRWISETRRTERPPNRAIGRTCATRQPTR